MPILCNEDKITAELCRRSYYEFLKEFWDVTSPEKPVWNWHIEVICNELQTVMERVFRNEPKEYDLVINISPGTTKSTAASVCLVPWCWTRMPTLKSLNGSHTQDLVLELSRKAREIVYSEKYQRLFGPITLRQDQNTKGNWANQKGGSRFSCTVGGKSPIGMHAHVHVVDDPIDPQKAISEAEIASANAWMTSTLSTRKINKSVTPLILIMQRLAQNDPAGMILTKKNIRNVCLPAELTDKVNPPELAKLYVDGLMDPERLGYQVLEEYKANGDYFYSGQFLQNPIPVGGGMFKTEKLVWEDVAPGDWHFKEIVRCWDNAGSPTGTKYDRRRKYTVGLKMGRHTNGSFWILDVMRDRFRTDEREALKRHTAEEDGIHVTVVQEQEGGSGGQESVENTVRNLAGFKIKIDNPKGDKTLRADPFSHQVNIGNVHLVKAPWNKDYLEEMKHFPFSTYKDQIDTSSAAFAALYKPRRRVGPLFPTRSQK
jgi:predicted phage terminase large subunit-like protein